MVSDPFHGRAQVPDAPLLCLSSLTHRRFIDDAIQVVGLPDGARIRLRYRKSYVAPHVLDMISKGEGKGLVVYCVLIGDEADGTDQYAPIRSGRITDLQREGEIVVLEISLGGYIADPHDRSWNSLAKTVPSLPEKIAGQVYRSGHFLQQLISKPAFLMPESKVEAWECAADAFFRIGADKVRIPFLYQMKLADDPCRDGLKGSGELRVESGSDVCWDIHVKSAPNHPDFSKPCGEVLIDLACAPLTMITSRRIRVDSRRDVRRMRARCGSGFRSIFGHLSIRVVEFTYPGEAGPPASKNGREETVLSRHDLPVKGGNFVPLAASSAAALAAGLAVLHPGQPWFLAPYIPALVGATVFLSLRLGFKDDGKLGK